MSRTASSMTSRLRRPRKSILSRPSASTSPIAYCVTSSASVPFRCSGRYSTAAVADHDAGGVDGVGPDEALERPRHVDELAHELVLVVGLAQLLARLHALLEADLHAFRDELRDAVDGAEGQAQHAAGVAHRGLRGELAERDDLRHALAPVLLGHVVDHALAAVHREVDVDVGHRLAARVQEALEQQVVADRVDVGDAQRVGHERAGGRAAARADADAVGLGEADEVPDDQEVVGEAHLADRLELELEPVAAARVSVAVALGQPGSQSARRYPNASSPGTSKCGSRMRSSSILTLQRSAISSVGRSSSRPYGAIAPAHLVGGLEEELLVREPEALRVRELVAGLDAEQRLVRVGVLGAQVVHVAGADDRQAGLVGQRQQARVDLWCASMPASWISM